MQQGYSEVSKGPMSRFQVFAIGLCGVIQMLDGFDVLAMAFVSSHVSAEWHLTGKELGFLLSIGLFGIAIGSVLLAPMADKIGRRTLILICLPTIAIGMVLSSLAQDITQLWALRMLTGLGIGGIMPSINVITAEYASDKWRATAITLSGSGYSLGATLGGLVAGVLLAKYGWRSVFLFGGILTALLIPFVYKGLPESIDFLITRRPANALKKMNVVLQKMGRLTIGELPAFDRSSGYSGKRKWAGILSRSFLSRTLSLCVTWWLVMFSVYFVLSWTPKLMVVAGLDAQQGVKAAVGLNVGGIFGGLLFALFAIKIAARRLVCVFFFFTACIFAGLGYFISSSTQVFILAILGGVGAYACMLGMYAITPSLFPPQYRGTAMGWAVGIGRLGAVVAPMVAGALLDATWHPTAIYMLFALPLVIATATVGFLGSFTEPTSEVRIRTVP